MYGSACLTHPKKYMTHKSGYFFKKNYMSIVHPLFLKNRTNIALSTCLISNDKMIFEKSGHEFFFLEI